MGFLKQRYCKKCFFILRFFVKGIFFLKKTNGYIELLLSLINSM